MEVVSSIGSYQVATRIEFGLGASATAGREMAGMGRHHSLIVTDEGVVRAGLLEGIEKSLAASGVALTVFDRVHPDPTTDDVDSCAASYLEAGCDALIAVGGGSVLDCSKAAGVVIANGGRFEDYLLSGRRAIQKAIPTLVTVPTTAGTGSEVTRSVVITHAESHSKIGLINSLIVPAVALVDPELTLSLPQQLTASTGLDALCHGIERYTSTTATPMNDVLALGAIKMVSENLRQAYANPRDRRAREGMMWAALLGGMPCSNVSAGHIIAAVVGGSVRIPHGTACAILQPSTMQFNLISNPRKFAAIAAAMGEDVAGLPIMDAAHRSVEAVKRLMVDVGMTRRLSDFGLTREQVPELAETCLALRGKALAAQNPRLLGKSDIEMLISSCFD